LIGTVENDPVTTPSTDAPVASTAMCMQGSAITRYSKATPASRCHSKVQAITR
jgi:hypothetical protein